eukprot:comp18100_c0_seq1/m.18739 comp18100_c0_seq1/g.18739  ORF comp18100_c0_seq1/g.18739 comp18100_c0_seq1/m.18739 type:complete len:319 (-) comp18100_c0_seq1:581-1537(-)
MKEGSGSTEEGGSDVERITRWALNFDFVLDDIQGQHVFMEFLRKEYSECNLEFFLLCAQFRDRPCLETRNLAYDIYCKDHGEKQLALTEETRVALDRAMGTPVPSRDMFFAAQHEVKNLLFDSYLRFLKSDIYCGLLVDAFDAQTPQQPSTRPKERMSWGKRHIWKGFFGWTGKHKSGLSVRQRSVSDGLYDEARRHEQHLSGLFEEENEKDGYTSETGESSEREACNSQKKATTMRRIRSMEMIRSKLLSTLSDSFSGTIAGHSKEKGKKTPDSLRKNQERGRLPVDRQERERDRGERNERVHPMFTLEETTDGEGD